MKNVRRKLVALLGVCLLMAPSKPARAYSLLTHEELIDLTWDSSIVPLIKSRYPTITPAELEHARAYAYGGCVIQDIGYYPFGDANFSNLTHYVRSGDFVIALFRNAGNADELAFAIGALSHYIGDNIGHSTATNLAVPAEFPKLGAKYGRSVPYADGEHQHVQTEFAFDIDEISHHRFAPVNYLRSIGLEVPTKQLALAFYQTYGIQEDFTQKRGHRLNVGTYRWAVHRFIPRIAYSVTLLHRNHEVPEPPNDPDVQRLDREVALVAKTNHWDDFRKQPGPLTHLLAGIIWVIPKVGPIKLAAVKGPTVDSERDYIHSVLASQDALTRALHRFTPPPAQGPGAALAAADDTHASPPASAPLPAQAGASQAVPRGSGDPRHPLTNRDLDTGRPVKPAGYRLTDDTYAVLLHRLAATPTQAVPPGIKSDILQYYADLSLPYATKKKPEAWAQVQKDLGTFQTIPTSNEPVPYSTYGDGADADPVDDPNAPAPPASK